MIPFKLIFLFIFISCLNILSAQTVSPRDRVTEVFHAKQVLPNGSQIQETTFLWCGDQYNKNQYQQLISLIGWVYPTNCTVQHIKKDNTGRSYNVFYQINHLGQRIYPFFKTTKKKHLIVGGDSNSFGHGVGDRDSLPFILGEKNKSYHPYNFAQCGGGPSNTLALLESTPWEKEILEKEGRMIYIFYPEWMSNRVYGGKDFLSFDKGRTPWYALNKKKELIRKGVLLDSWQSKALLLINFIDRFHLVGDLPKMNINHAELISNVLINIKNEYLKKFPKGQFTLVLSSYGLTRNHYIPEIISFLKKSNVEVVEINKHEKHKSEWHLLDSHFGPLGQRMTAAALEELIKF